MKRTRSAAQLSTHARPPLKRQRRMPMYRPVNRLPATQIARRTEVKTVDYPNGSNTLVQNIGQTAYISLVNGIAEGTSFFNRIGRKVSLKSLQIVGQVVQNSAGTPTNDYAYWRIMLVYDRQNNGTTPAIADIIQDVDAAGNAWTTPLSGLNMNNSDRFRVLADIRGNITSDSTASAMPPLDGSLLSIDETNINRYIKLGGLETHFQTGNANAAACGNGAVWLVLYGSEATATSMIKANLKIRVRYYDQ